MIYKHKHRLFKYLLCTASVVLIALTFGNMNPFLSPVDKTGRYLQKIKDIEYKLSLKKITAQAAAAKMKAQVDLIKKQYAKISAEEKIKEPLGLFLKKWHSQELIFDSITDRKHQFMAEVNSFFGRGLVKYRSGWKTLFPLFRP